jgi:hypothetical protein
MQQLRHSRSSDNPDILSGSDFRRRTGHYAQHGHLFQPDGDSQVGGNRSKSSIDSHYQKKKCSTLCVSFLSISTLTIAIASKYFLKEKSLMNV